MAAADPAAPQKIVFIDRDGVINVDPIGDYIKSWNNFKFEKGALEALKKISGLGYGIIVISNQAGIGDGVYPESELWNIHDNMARTFKENGVNFLRAYYCLHGKQAGCRCRKPETGLFEQAAKDYAFDRSKTFFIGDKFSDVKAGKRFGLKTIMVLTGHGKLDEPQAAGLWAPDLKAADLFEAVKFLK